MTATRTASSDRRTTKTSAAKAGRAVVAALPPLPLLLLLLVAASSSPSSSDAFSASPTVPASRAQNFLLKYAATSDVPIPRRSFEERMRDLVAAQRTAAPTTRKKGEREQAKHADKASGNAGFGGDDNVHEATNLEEFRELVGDETERIAVVRFYAPWCRSCRASEPHFKSLSRRYPNLKFVDVALGGSTKALVEGLGVPSVPYGHVYYPRAGLVDEGSVSRKNFSKFARSLESYVNGECQLSRDVDPETRVFASPYSATKSTPTSRQAAAV